MAGPMMICFILNGHFFPLNICVWLQTKKGRKGVSHTGRDVQLLLFHSAVVVVTVSLLQVLFRRKRQMQRRGATHLSQSHLPGAVSVKGFPNTLIQVNHTCYSHRSQSERTPNVGEAVTGFAAVHVSCYCQRSSEGLVMLYHLDVFKYRNDPQKPHYFFSNMTWSKTCRLLHINPCVYVFFRLIGPGDTWPKLRIKKRASVNPASAPSPSLATTWKPTPCRWVSMAKSWCKEATFIGFIGWGVVTGISFLLKWPVHMLCSWLLSGY